MEKTNNELIAEFMGYKYYPYKPEEKGLSFGWIKGDRRSIGMEKIHPDVYLCRTNKELRYNRSWDWLMLVVEKIESLGFYFVTTNGEDGNEVMIHNEFYSYRRNESTLVVGINFLPKEVTKLQSMYKAVVDFIKWYNEK